MACAIVLQDRPLVRADIAISAHTDLAPTPRAAPLGRIFIREHLASVLTPRLLDDVMLLTSELVTNVVMHARTDVHLGLTYDDNNIMVSVQDHSDATPTERAANAGAALHLEESGRGMAIIASLADDFGWQRLPVPPGKVMWFVMGIPPREGAG
jgi:anti-sigma regulatory factor (Ser/Thr protein kinase)